MPGAGAWPVRKEDQNAEEFGVGQIAVLDVCGEPGVDGLRDVRTEFGVLVTAGRTIQRA